MNFPSLSPSEGPNRRAVGVRGLLMNEAGQILAGAFTLTVLAIVVACLNADSQREARSVTIGILILAAIITTVVLIVNANG